MDYSEPCQYSIKLIEKLELLDTEKALDFGLIQKSIYWAKKYHDGQFRKSGEPFYTHPLEVAYMLSNYKLKTDVIVTAILHDIVEDTEVTAGMILDAFSRRIEEMVDRLTRDRPDGSKLSVEEILNNAYNKNDKEVLLIKLIDRLHNANTVLVKTPEKINKLLDNTLGNFIVLASYLNLSKTEASLSNLCISLSQLDTNCKQLNFSSLREGNYQLPSLDFQNEINQIYSPKLEES
jgi:(p)ppGpp synthase/HD superfamily hydrolase